MTRYHPSWELETIPDDKWASEHGRRQRLKGPSITYVVLKPCGKCGLELTATEYRRKLCVHCGEKHKQKRV